MINFDPIKYKVYKVIPETEEQYQETRYWDDEYGSSHSEPVFKWRKFESELLWLEPAPHPMYSGTDEYYPLAPSGKYNSRFAGLYYKKLRNLDCVGNYDGKEFDFEVPYLYTSIHELDLLDVFQLCEDYRSIEVYNKKGNIIKKNTPLVVEGFEKILFEYSGGVLVSKFDEPDSTLKSSFILRGDVKVEKLGKIELIRNFKRI
jgi:hypothetical protein